jgi:hypothetical protein
MCPPAHPPVSFPVANSRATSFGVGENFCQRASAQSLTILNKAGHRNSVNGDEVAGGQAIYGLN